MPEGAIARLVDALSAMVLRRVRFLTILVMIGAGGVILTQDFSWSSILLAVACMAALVFGWLGITFWIWVFRNARGRRET